MRRSWMNIATCWPGQEGPLLLRLREKFPQHSFKLGKRGVFAPDMRNIEIRKVMGLMPLPHPNDTAKEVVVWAHNWLDTDEAKKYSKYYKGKGDPEIEALVKRFKEMNP